MKNFGGKVLFLDRSDINTDEIIPARYLTEITKVALKPYLLEDLEMEGFDPTTDIDGKAVVVTRANFGCGSSREHAPWAFEINDINVVIASNFARIFRQNMYNCGMMAIDMSEETIEELFAKYSGAECAIEFDLTSKKFSVNGEAKYDFTISNFDEALVNAGGWVEYADKNY